MVIVRHTPPPEQDSLQKEFAMNARDFTFERFDDKIFPQHYSEKESGPQRQEPDPLKGMGL